MAAELSVTAGIWQGCWLVTAVGEIDPTTASLLEQALAVAPARLPIILDLDSVVSIEPSALQSLLGGHGLRRRLAIVRSSHANADGLDIGPNSGVSIFDDLLTAISDSKRRKLWPR